MYLSAKRELNRQRWYKKMNELAIGKQFDAIIFPSATYRYLRALNLSSLKHSPVPVLFLIHGVTPKECDKLNAEAEKFISMPNIRIGVQTFAKEKLSLEGANIKLYGPPNYIPRDINANEFNQDRNILKLGFFGQYRKEKNLDAFLDVFAKCKFNRSLKLVVQGSTQTPTDAADFERIINKYKNTANLEFWHRPLIGIEWQKGLASVDTLVMPYGNDRYLYHTSAILSNAIGYGKTVISANNVNPEILEEYDIGVTFENGNPEALKNALEQFVNTYDKKQVTYKAELARAYAEFAPSKLAENIVALAMSERK